MIKKINFNFALAIAISLTTVCSINRSLASAYVNFSTDADGHIFIKAKVNGTSGNFIFDTGAGLTLVTQKFASKIPGLKPSYQNFTGFRATGEAVSVNLSGEANLAIGEFRTRAPVIGVIDADLGPADGLISLSSFKNQVFTIDYERKRLIFEEKGTVASLRRNGYVIPVQQDIARDKSVDIFAYFIVNKNLVLQFLIDSGAGDNVFRINARYMQQFGIDTVAAKKGYHKSEFNPNIVTHYYIAEVKSIAVKSTPAIFINTTRVNFIEGMIYDGIVSLSWISKKITFDLKNSELIIQKHPVLTPTVMPNHKF
jgi:hypothetical protein